MIDELKSNTTLMMFSGFIGIIFGLTIILHASLAEAGIHFLGVVLRYVILVEGVLKILFPSFYFGVLEFIITKFSVRLFSILIFLLGLVLVYQSFLIKFYFIEKDDPQEHDFFTLGLVI